ncbi:MAG: endo-1,4-beta-xylanase [Treponema sp.]|nr:endo-1,4-beta-xylanase [Treponema sp.]
MIKKSIVIYIIVLLILNITACETGGSGSRNTRNTQRHVDLPLKTIYQDYFLIGNIVNNTYLRENYLHILKTHYNTVTSENHMKPDHLAPRQQGGQYQWTSADNQLRVMTENGIKVHGHTLVWHNQTPQWMTQGTPAQVRQNMTAHINTVLAHYKGKIFSWDVVNEAVKERVNPGEDLTNWRTHLREDSEWFKALGADYIELAFRTARAADPDLLLYYNDYNLDNSRKAQVTANMIKDINDRYRAQGNNRNLIDGIGMQGHYGLSTSVANVRASIERFIAIGIKVDISELDVEIRSVGSGRFGTGRASSVSEMDARLQAIKYAELFNMFKEYKGHITRVTMWGIDDDTSWKSLGNPVLFDRMVNPKPAFFAVANPNRALGL